MVAPYSVKTNLFRKYCSIISLLNTNYRCALRCRSSLRDYFPALKNSTRSSPPHRFRHICAVILCPTRMLRLLGILRLADSARNPTHADNLLPELLFQDSILSAILSLNSFRPFSLNIFKQGFYFSENNCEKCLFALIIFFTIITNRLLSM